MVRVVWIEESGERRGGGEERKEERGKKPSEYHSKCMLCLSVYVCVCVCVRVVKIRRISWSTARLIALLLF